MNPQPTQPGFAKTLAPERGAGGNVRAPWLAWSLCLLCVALALVSLILALLNGRTLGEIFVEDIVAAIAVLAVAYSFVGALIASRHPGNPIGWIFCFAALFQGLLIFVEEYATYALIMRPGTLPLGAEASWLREWIWAPGLGLFLVFLPLLFPDGRLPSRRWRWVGWLGGLSIGLISVLGCVLFWPHRGPELMRYGGGAEYVVAPVWALVTDFVAFPMMLVAGLGAVISLFVRFRRAGREERQQIKWFASASALTLVFVFALDGLPHAEGGPTEAVLVLLGILIVPAIPVATGVAIFRYRLYDIDLVINRTLVYGALTACVVGIYVFVVGYLGAVFQTSGNLAVSLVATGIIAVIFQPLRDRLQRGANRLMYGERDDPYGVISRLGRRLEGTLAPEAVLPTIVDDVARALRLPQTGIWLTDGDTLRLEAFHGEAPMQTTAGDPDAIAKLRHAPDRLYPANLDPSGEYGTLLAKSGAALVLPLSHRGELVGAMSLSPRSPGEEFSQADRRLLRDLATQAGAAAHAVRLTVALRSSLEELRQSRERLVAAQEEERRRIQRDLHDGLGPVLASMRLRLEACLDTSQETKGSTSEAPLADDLERLYELVGQATGDIRRLVYDLRPPVLDQLGLVPALRQHCERFHRETGIEVNFEAEADLPVPAAAEAALLRVAQEALLNVEKHARASRVDARLERSDGWISLVVRDDGVGPDAEGRNGRTGTGIGSMRERADLLGGTLFIGGGSDDGTEVVMRIPVGTPDREGVK